MLITACGVFNCDTCSHRERGRCPGCDEGNRVQASEGGEQCAIYLCVVSKGLTSCKECTSAVCQYPRTLEMVCPIRGHFEKKRCYSRRLSDHYMARQEAARQPAGETRTPQKTLVRMRSYLFAIDDFLSRGIGRVSSEDISRKVGVKDYMIRRDLSQFGGFGRPSIGYDAAFLRSCLVKVLHLDDRKRILWVGADGVLSSEALLKRCEGYGFDVVAILDTRTSGRLHKMNQVEVHPFKQAAEVIESTRPEGAVLAVPPDEAQAVADALIGLGIRGILNLTSAVIVAPPDVCVRNVDVIAELVALSYYCREAHGEDRNGSPRKS